MHDERVQDTRIHDKRIHPAYAEGFRCIGAACEDTCCKGWTVPVDRAAWEKYQALPEGPLRVLVNSSVAPRKAENDEAQSGADARPAQPFATIRMNGGHECPLLTEERLCRIQSELGADMLPDACTTYPRIAHSLDRVEEKALMFSCPEAVRLVLLTPDLPLRVDCADGTEEEAAETANTDSLLDAFWPIRTLVLKLVRARTYPLWQRLFLLKLLCERLDSIRRGELKRSVREFLSDFEAAVATGSLRAAMETLPVDRAAQLDIVLRLAGLMLQKSIVTPRFEECVRAFTAGIGNGPGATLESLTAQYTLAHDRYYSPFFERRPHIMENLLFNTIFRGGFPFGKDGMGAETQPSMSGEFTLLAAQFVLMRGLLIGVAGHHRAAFSETHVVHTVQAAAKHFEHHIKFLDMAHALLVESRMDGARGIAILLRNAEAKRGVNQSIPASIGPASGPASIGVSNTEGLSQGDSRQIPLNG